METKANEQQQQQGPKDPNFVPGGIAGQVHENAIQEKVGRSRFHAFLAEKIHPIILNIYKDYSVRGYFIMFLVSFVAIAIVVGIALGIYVAVFK